MNTDKKRPYERPTLEGKEIFGAEGLAVTCCKVAACTNAQKSGMGKDGKTSAVS